MGNQGSDGINWTDTTANPGIYGCNEVSPACANCYAAKMAHRLSAIGVYPEEITEKRASGVHWSGRVVVDGVAKLSQNMLRQLPKKKPGRVFVTSMSDIALDEVPDEFLDRLFGIFAVYPHLTFQVLTKRPARLRRWFEGWCRRDAVASEAEHHARMYMGLESFTWDSRGGAPERYGFWAESDTTRKLRQRRPWPGWPLPNVWIGCTVEDQARADERIPELLQIPAAVRFLSMEPLLGAVDLGRWIARVDHCSSCRAEHDVQTDDRCPMCGEVGSLISTWGEDQAEKFRTGARYDNGGPGPADDGPPLHWIIAGGESGSRARPTDPAWFRGVRDQCQTAGVPFLMKQWGEWAPIGVRLTERAFPKSYRSTVLPSGAVMERMGKIEAGRSLDGRTWDQFPEVNDARK